MSTLGAKQRIHYVDNGRAIASILGVFFHSANVFSRPWVINVDSMMWSQTIWAFSLVLTYFRMPLFLFIAGFFTMYGLRKYTIPKYLQHRSRRILLPLITAVALLLPIQHYFAFNHLYGIHWPIILSNYMNPVSAQFSFEHLWFLYYILLYSLLMAACRWLHQYFPVPSGAKRFVNSVHRNLATTIMFWAGLQGVMHVSGKGLEIVLDAHPGWFTFGGMGKNLPMFLFGCYCFAHHERMHGLFQLNRRRAVSIIGVFVVLFGLRMFLRLIHSPYEWIGSHAIDTVLRWVLVLGILSLLCRYFNGRSRIQNYFSDASYPVYVFHQPVIVAVSYVLLQSSWAYSAWTGYAFVTGCSLVLTYLAYEVLIRRNPVGAFLFTGKPLPWPSISVGAGLKKISNIVLPMRSSSR